MKAKRLSLTMAVLLCVSSSAFAASNSSTEAVDSAAATTTANAITTTSTNTNTTVTEQSKTPSTVDKAAAEKAAMEEQSRQKRITRDGFSDIENHWAKSAIQAMSKAKFISGFTDHSFRPDDSITREQVAAIYNNMITTGVTTGDAKTEKTSTQKSASFSDVSTDKWSHDAIINVANKKIMTSYTGDNFEPEHVMTREEFAVTAANYANYLGIQNKNTSSQVTYKDAKDIASYASASVVQLSQENFMGGDNKGNFNPTAPVTRAEATTVLYRISHPAVATSDPLDNEATAKATEEKTTATDSKKLKEENKENNKVSKEKSTSEAKPTKEEPTISNKQTDVEKDATETKTTNKPVVAETSAETSAQTALEDKAFGQLNKLYKTPAEFQNHGVMYWEADKLHVAVQNAKDLETLKSRFQTSKDSDLRNKIVLEPSRYSQSDYDTMTSEFTKLYQSHESNGQILSTVPDITNDRLYVVVNQATSITQKAVTSKFGDKVKLAIHK